MTYMTLHSPKRYKNTYLHSFSDTFTSKLTECLFSRYHPITLNKLSLGYLAISRGYSRDEDKTAIIKIERGYLTFHEQALLISFT